MRQLKHIQWQCQQKTMVACDQYINIVTFALRTLKFIQMRSPKVRRGRWVNFQRQKPQHPASIIGAHILTCVIFAPLERISPWHLLILHLPPKEALFLFSSSKPGHDGYLVSALLCALHCHTVPTAQLGLWRVHVPTGELPSTGEKMVIPLKMAW